MKLKCKRFLPSLLLTFTGVALSFSGGKSEAAVIDGRVFVQPIQVCSDSGFTCAPTRLFEPETDKIWGQAGIDIYFLPFRRLFNSAFLNIDSNSEFSSLVSGLNTRRYENQNVLNMWFVNGVFPSTTTVTYGLASLGGNGITIARETVDQNRIDTVAHEIGHNLGLPHPNESNNFYFNTDANSPSNLMTSGINRLVPSSINNIFPDGTRRSQLTLTQINQVRSSRFAFRATNVGDSVASVPESSMKIGLIGVGVLFLCVQLKDRNKRSNQTRH